MLSVTYGECHLCCVSHVKPYMVSDVMLNVVMLSVVMLSVVASNYTTVLYYLELCVIS
jgi:hypothetical protein